MPLGARLVRAVPHSAHALSPTVSSAGCKFGCQVLDDEFAGKRQNRRPTTRILFREVFYFRLRGLKVVIHEKLSLWTAKALTSRLKEKVCFSKGEVFSKAVSSLYVKSEDCFSMSAFWLYKSNACFIHQLCTSLIVCFVWVKAWARLLACARSVFMYQKGTGKSFNLRLLACRHF